MNERLPHDHEFWRRKRDGATVFVVDASPEYDPDETPTPEAVANGTVHLQWPTGHESNKAMPRFLAECEPCGPPFTVYQDPDRAEGP